ncbi:hypothetical protein HWV62_8899 [Athelia sp. TMB]|nr:hypothetical protein HWV62_8899 [Athelia sp. TMB]
MNLFTLAVACGSQLGNAKVAGLEKSLKLTDHQYEIAVTALYVPYIVAELPANLILRWVGPRILLPALLTMWGITATLQGLVTSFGGLVTVRFFLGLMEGPMFPGIVLYLSSFYTREELSLRVALFFSAASLSGAFSGLLAAAIENMNGVGGKPGWAWIFFLEGLFSVLMGILGFFVIPSTLQGSKFLSQEQKDLLERRLERDRPSLGVNDKFSFRDLLHSAKSLHVILVFIMFFGLGTTLFGLALFLPTIVGALGFSANRTQLLSVGPFATAFALTLVVAYLSDRYKTRGIPAAFTSILAVIGYAVYLTSTNKHITYGSLYLTVPGVYAAAPIMSAWMANNSEPHYRRASSVAFGFIATNAGGILSTWSFPSKEAPRYTKTTIMNLTLSAVVVVVSLANMLILDRKNKQKIQKRADVLAPYGDDAQSNEKAWKELGDQHPDFRYTL